MENPDDPGLAPYAIAFLVYVVVKN